MVLYVVSTAAWVVAGFSCSLHIVMEMHMKMFVEVSLDWHVALQGQSVKPATLVGEAAKAIIEHRSLRAHVGGSNPPPCTDFEAEPQAGPLL